MMPDEAHDFGPTLVLVAQCHSDRLTEAFLNLIPPSLRNHDGLDFLFIPHESTGEDVDALTRCVQDNDLSNVTVMRVGASLGYGGNQKLGYRIAIDRGYEAVIQLPVTGHYALEFLPQFLEELFRSEADVLLGSRMLDLAAARGHGMSVLRTARNRFLNWFQNLCTTLGLTDYQTEYRGYSISLLKRIPFESNTNDDHFDTQVLLQAAHIKANIKEIPISLPHQNLQNSRTSTIRYAKRVIGSAIQFKMHQMGALCSLNYRDLSKNRYRDKTQCLYSSHTKALEVVEQAKPQSLLDIGCGPGFVARECTRAGVVVTGMDRSQPLEGMMSKFHIVDLERDSLPVNAFEFDMILLLDVLEHLEDPERFLVSLRNQDQSDRSGRHSPVLVVCTPNVAFAAIRFNLLMGRFNYAERGILDITHKRFFTRGSLKRMLENCGYEVMAVRAVPVPFAVVVGGWKGRILGRIAEVLAWIRPQLFAFQFLVTCRPHPGVGQILRERSSVEGRA